MNAYLVECSVTSKSPSYPKFTSYYIITYPRLSMPIFKKLLSDAYPREDIIIVRASLYDENVQIERNKIWSVSKFGTLSKVNDYDDYVDSFQEEM